MKERAMRIENRQKFLGMIALTVLGLLAADRAVVGPLTGWWGKRAREITTLRAQVAEGKALIRRSQAIHGRWDDMRANALTNNPSLAQEQVLKTFVSWAQESGASINGLNPQWKNDSEAYKTLACRVDASGSLWTLSRFLYDIEKGPIALKVESLELGAHDNDGQQLTLGLQVSGLVLPSSTR
jgi:hypothetical protein